MMTIERTGIRTAILRAHLTLLALALLCCTGDLAAQTGDPGDGRTTRSGRMEARVPNGGTIRSTDGGASWTIVSDGQLQQELREQARGAALAELSGAIRITSIARSGSALVVRYELTREIDIAIGICSVGGSLVAEEHQGMRPPGAYTIALDAGSLRPGGYCYRAVSGGTIVTSGKFILE